MKKQIQMDKDSKLIEKAMKNRPYTLVVDLDGTLAKDDKWVGFSHIGRPLKSKVQDIRQSKRAGCFIIIHTCRVTTLDNKVHPQSFDTIRAWLKKHRIPYDEIWMSVGKPFGNEYWDDKAVNIFCKECMERSARSRFSKKL